MTGNERSCGILTIAGPMSGKLPDTTFSTSKRLYLQFGLPEVTPRSSTTGTAGGGGDQSRELVNEVKLCELSVEQTGRVETRFREKRIIAWRSGCGRVTVARVEVPMFTQG